MKYYRYYRSWMYDRLYSGRGELKPNFEEGDKSFITWAFSQECCRSEGEVRCPYLKCECTPIISDRGEVEGHLKKKGFIENYWVLTYNEEKMPSRVPETSNTHGSSSRSPVEHGENFNLSGEIVGDAFGVNLTYDKLGDFVGEELSNEEAQRF
ncbi:unnamed protein product [Lathyrus sativus]|nr:unnamed protein product [Lathyrus sativus]